MRGQILHNEGGVKMGHFWCEKRNRTNIFGLVLYDIIYPSLAITNFVASPFPWDEVGYIYKGIPVI